MPLLIALAFLVASVALGTATATATSLKPEEVPDPLRPWVPWVLHAEKERACPFVFNAHTSRRCAWPARLDLRVSNSAAEFKQSWEVYKEAWVLLPGDAEHWPEEVSLDGQPAVVMAREGRPQIRLPAGPHQITGRLRWEQAPDSLLVPPDTALIHLRVGDAPLRQPTLQADGRLWLREQQATRHTPERHFALQVYRRLIDELPMQLITRIELDVSGPDREEWLAGALLPEFIPLSLASPLPARLEPDGRLRVQLRPGRWILELTGRTAGDTTRLTLPSQPEPWPTTEVWSFEARNHLRLVEVEGVPAVDPRQTKLPENWHALPAYRVSANNTLHLKVIRRGDPEPAPDRMDLNRQLWLDMDGQGYTVRDHITGSVTRAWRIEAGPRLLLGRVALDGVPQFITTREGAERPGVEVRRGALDLSADSRYEGDRGELPAVGWDHDVRALSATLHLPPGWRLFAAGGSDDVTESWLQRWSLLDLFLVLIATVAIDRLWGRAAAVLGLSALALLWHEPGAPELVWLNLIAATALLGALPEGWFKRLTRGYRNLAFVVLALIAVPFAVDQVRLGLYPQLERPSAVMPEREMSDAQTTTDTRLDKRVTGAPGVEDEPSSEGTVAPDEALRAFAPASAPAPLALQEAKPPMALGEIDPKARIQTGPGLPEWRWSEVSLRWRGPVERDQSLRLLLLSPSMNLVLNVVRALLMAALAVRLARPPGTPFFGRPQGVHAVAILTLFALFAPHSEVRADFPDRELLKELQTRLLEPPTCLPSCAQLPRMSLEITPAALRLRLLVHAAEAVAIPLPGQAEQWLPQELLLDDRPASGLSRDGAGGLWLSVTPGHHEIMLNGPAPAQRQVQLPLPLRPRRIELRAEGWRVEGVRDNGVPEAQLQLTRVEGAGEPPPIAPGPLPGLMRLTRTLRLGLDWRVESEIERLSAPGVPLSAAVPLLDGESITTADLRVKDGKVLVSLPPDQTTLRWESVLEGRSALRLRAAETTAWVEVWRVDVSPIWHLSFDGLAPVHHQDPGGRWLPEWRPWPGEGLTLTATRPRGVPGASLTIQRSRLAIRIGARSSDVRLTLEMESGQGGQHTLRLPEEARLEEVRIEGRAQPIRQSGTEVTLPLHPGRQRFDLLWREPRGIASLFRSPRIDLGSPSVNHALSMSLGNDRWLLLTGGPPLGPAVLFWGLIAVIALGAFGLGRVSLTPLKSRHWFLLGVGLSQAPVWGALTVIGWLLALGLRRRLRPDLQALRYDAVQLALGLLSLIALLLLFDAIQRGLLGLPEMQVAGNGSSAYSLNWYQDRVSREPPQAWLVSVPLLAYRLLMLGWALWLAIALLGWLRWGWGSLTTGGLWRPLRTHKAAPATPTGQGTASAAPRPLPPER